MFISTRTLSIPNPINAANTCSIVNILAPFFESVVPRAVLTTRLTSASIIGFDSMSNLLNLIPWLTGAL